jgi:hypothetical protein
MDERPADQGRRPLLQMTIEPHDPRRYSTGTSATEL